VAQVALWRHPVADQALELCQLREAARLARPQQLVVEPDLEHPAGARQQGHLAQLVLKSGEQLLRRPSGAQQPSALGAVLDLEPGSPHGHEV
jgi:hypothetical protein